MGCTPVKQKGPLLYKDSPVGLLKVTILGVQINDNQKREGATLRVRVSNQHFQTKYLPPVDSDKIGGDCFTYCINSFYKSQGRAIEIGYFDGQKMVSFGTVDANPILFNKQPLQFRLILSRPNQNLNQHGFVLLRAVFEVVPIYDLTFRFQEATIRRKSHSCAKDNVAVRLSIGQEIRQTQFVKDTQNSPAVWHETKYNFKIPVGVTRGTIQIVDQADNVIGQAQLYLPDFCKVKEGDEIIQNQTLMYNKKGEVITAAELKYSFILGQYANFKPRDKIFSSSIRAIRPKDEFSEGQRSYFRQY